MKALAIFFSLLISVATSFAGEYAAIQIGCTAPSQRLDLNIQHHVLAGISVVSENTAMADKIPRYIPREFQVSPHMESTRLVIGPGIGPLYPNTPVRAIVLKTADLMNQPNFNARVAKTTTEELAAQTTVFENAQCQVKPDGK